jgi:CRP-like cAMP-binding protein
MGSSSSTALLAEMAMFRGTPRLRIAELARQALSRQVPNGGVIARRGECLPGLMVVRYGLAKLSFRRGRERVLRLVGPGETFGEAALFLGLPLPVDVVALADTGLLVVPAAPVLALFDDDPRFARGLLSSICRKLQSVVADFESASAHGARERLAGYLASLGESSASLPAEKRVIAARLGMSQETLSRLLRGFIDEGLIAVAKREIRLLDRARLSAAAQASASSEA